MADGAGPPAAAPPADFARRLLAWHERHGRHDLPWQRSPTPYRVWVSEIMLQQTQVQTVIGYFERFMHAFPDVAALAKAPLDEVLHLWSGLGYYARARNLHRAAGVLVEQYAGRFPETLEAMMALPGIGRSTAGAILALSMNRHHAILDGNVRRVLCRHRGVEGWPGAPAVERELWQLAEALTPESDVARYTQAIMDLGATLCTRTRPACALCPLVDDCVAHNTHRVAQLPAPRPRRARPIRSTCMLLITSPESRVLLRRRPPQGIWGGLWAPLEVDLAGSAGSTARVDIIDASLQALGLARIAPLHTLATLRHAFTHFELEIEPVHVRVEARGVMDDGEYLWYNPQDPQRLGLAAPVATLLHSLQGERQ
ncbi:MAG: A/G-specific adenine glycosylase [Gammaproteobacteria bacterium]|nr:A/G-specific adenine glycosylase [Gammaproteobacteria bacterium]